jgi:SAM-dependent methyltransferase
MPPQGVIQKAVLSVVQRLVPSSLRTRLGGLRRALAARSYAGTTHACSVCGAGLRGFRPLAALEGGKYVADVDVAGRVHKAADYETLNLEAFQCPACAAPDKARLYALYLAERLPSLTAPARLVHFAPEGGLSTFIKGVNPGIEYRTADLNRSDVDDQADLTDLRCYADASVAAFLCSHILEHVPDDRAAMRELFRILHPRGFGIVMVPILLSLDGTYEDPSKTTPAERLRHFGLEDHLRIYAKADFVARLQKVGFAVDTFGVEHFGAERFRRHGITPTSVLYVVRKPAD